MKYYKVMNIIFNSFNFKKKVLIKNLLYFNYKIFKINFKNISYFKF